MNIFQFDGGPEISRGHEFLNFFTVLSVDHKKLGDPFLAVVTARILDHILRFNDLSRVYLEIGYFTDMGLN